MWKAVANDAHKLVISLGSKRLLILVGVAWYWSHQHQTKANGINSCKVGAIIGDEDKCASSFERRSSCSSIKLKLVGETLYWSHHRTAKSKCSSGWWWKAGVIKDDDN